MVSNNNYDDNIYDGNDDNDIDNSSNVSSDKMIVTMMMRLI